MIHLTPADYRTMLWANGRGQTIEMLRNEQDGLLLCRLSKATVAENGPFSLFPGVERNLTVLTGPGFDLRGSGLHLTARPLVPVAFAGDVALDAAGVIAPSDDFNVMTARHLPRPTVTVHSESAMVSTVGVLALFSLGAARVNGRALGHHELMLTAEGASIEGPLIAVDIFGVPLQRLDPSS